jgi:aspartate racemase
VRLLGLLGGMSWQSTAIYYRLLNEGARERLGGAHSARLLLWSLDFATVTGLKKRDDWRGLEKIALDATHRLEQAGAKAIVICSNTMHRVVASLEGSLSTPIINIFEVTADAIQKVQTRRPILLGTRYTMEGELFQKTLSRKCDIEVLLPSETTRQFLHDVIYNELCEGIINPESRRKILDECDLLRRQGADGVILGCTELTMLFNPQDFPFPTFDTTKIHVASALDFALMCETRDGTA